MSRQRLLSILWAIEFIVGLSPAAVLMVIGLVPYLVVTPAVLSLLLRGKLRLCKPRLCSMGQ
jgi:ABC-type enterochelin transport system permease subunit